MTRFLLMEAGTSTRRIATGLSHGFIDNGGGENDASPVATVCRLLPFVPPVVRPGFSTLSTSVFTWDVVLLVFCTSYSTLKDMVDQRTHPWQRMPAGHDLRIIVYDVCTGPDWRIRNGPEQHSDQGWSAIYQALLEHILATMYSQRLVICEQDGHCHADRRPHQESAQATIMLVADAPLDSHAAAGLPARFEKALAQVVDNFLRVIGKQHSLDPPASLGRWLMLMEGPQGREDVCYGYKRLFSSGFCSASDAAGRETPQVIAFPNALLQNATLAEWEVAASVPVVDADTQTVLNLVSTLLAKTAEESGGYETVVVPYGNGSGASDCLSAFQGQRLFAESSGMPFVAGPILLVEEARACFAHGGGAYLLVRSGLIEGIVAGQAAWKPYLKEVSAFRAALGGLRQEDWQHIEVFGVCSPPPPVCIPERDGVALAWQHLLRYTFGTRALDSLPVPDTAKVETWWESVQAVEHDLFGAS